MKTTLPERNGEGANRSTVRYEKIETVIFDLDGVLIDSSEGIIDTTNFVLRSLGFAERLPEEVKSFIGCPLPKMFAEFAPEADYEHIRPLFRQRAREVIVQTSELLPYVTETLQCLQELGVSMGIGSTKIREHILGVVEKFSFESYIDERVVVGGDEATPKPAPDIFLLALERLGASRTTTVVVGDTINDVLAAQAAGLPVALVESDFGSREELAQHPATDRFDSLRHFTETICHSRNRVVGSKVAE